MIIYTCVINICMCMYPIYHTYTHVYIYSTCDKYMYVYIFICMVHIHTCIHTHMHIYACIYVYVYVYTHTLVSVYILTEDTRSGSETKTLVTYDQSSNQSNLEHQFSESQSPQGGGKGQMVPAHCSGLYQGEDPLQLGNSLILSRAAGDLFILLSGERIFSLLWNVSQSSWREGGDLTLLEWLR